MENLSRGRLSLSDEIYNQILVRISEGVWKEGEKIPSESQLCEMFRVSRVSVRAAIQKLQGQGLITTMQGVGSFVSAPRKTPEVTTAPSSDISGQAFLEFFEFRQAIEFKAIDLFVVRATNQEMEHLHSLVENMQRSCENRKFFTDCDFDFHMSILKGSKNTFLYNAMVPYKDAFYHYMEEITRLTQKEMIQLAKEHKELYQALADKRPSLAKEMLLADNAFYHVTIFKRVNQ